MTLSKLFRTTALAATFALGLSHTASATSSAEQLQQASAAYQQMTNKPFIGCKKPQNKMFEQQKLC